MENVWYLYLHRRSDCDEIFYIGIGSTPKCGRAYSKSGRNPHWKNVVNKCGYSVEIVYSKLSHEEACQKEIELIAYFREFLVNMTEGGEGSRGNKYALGRKHTDEAKEKIRQAHLGNKHSDETREKLREINLGKKMSPEAIEKTRQAHLGNKNALGNKHSDETREKIRRGNLGNKYALGKKHSDESKEKMSKSKLGNNHPRSKPVNQYDLEGNLIKTYSYMKEAEQDGFNQGHISACCLNKLKSHKGFIWRYVVQT